MSNGNNKPKSFRRLFAERGGGASIVILLLVIAAEIGALAYGRLANRFNREGVVTTGIVTAVEQYTAFDFMQLYAESTDDYDDGDIITVTTFQYKDEAGNTYTDETRSRNLSIERIPQVGSGLEMRYLASDPTVNEARIGHIDDNVAALHWIAAFFGGLTLVYALWGAFKAYQDWNSTTERRKRRQAELAQD